MAWVRIHDGAMSHPKLVDFIDWNNPFCVWVWGLSYCQTHLTNGAIPRAAVPNSKAMKTAAKLVAGGVWETTPTGFQVHDYLDWNDSRELVNKKRSEARERMTNARHRSSREHIANFYVDRGVDRRSSLEGVPGEPAQPTGDGSAAERLTDAFRAHWKRTYGVECSLILKPLEFMQLEQHIAGHTEARLLAAMAAYFATSEDYVRRAKHPLALFLRDPLRHLAKDAVVPTRPAGCRHEPACVDAPAHTTRLLAERKAAS